MDTALTPQERATLEAAMARVIPTDEHPGAREAGAIDWLERYLAGDAVYAKPDGSGFQTLTGRLADAWERRIATLRERGVQVIGPDDGPLAEGESGPGRLREPEAIVAELAAAMP